MLMGTPDSWEDILRFAQDGTCWVCGRTGFVKLAQHLAMKHEIKADEVRETYGLSWSQSLASPAYTEAASIRSRELGLGNPSAFQHPNRAPRPRRAQALASMTEVANRPEVKEKLRQRNRDPAYNAKRAAGLRSSASAATQRADAREVRSAHRRAKASLVRDALQGETRRRQAIVDATGLTCASVSHCLDRLLADGEVERVGYGEYRLRLASDDTEGTV